MCLVSARLVNENIGNGLLSTVRQNLVGINQGYGGLTVPLLRNLYNTFISVIGGK